MSSSDRVPSLCSDLEVRLWIRGPRWALGVREKTLVEVMVKGGVVSSLDAVEAVVVTVM